MEIKTKTLRGNVGSIFAVDGQDGKSAYEVALDNGFEGTEEEWLASLKGEKGETGLSEWDHVITDAEDFTTENLATMSGRVLVKNLVLDLQNKTITIPSAVSLIYFINTRYTASPE
jgi:hypothetical protein